MTVKEFALWIDEKRIECEKIATVLAYIKAVSIIRNMIFNNMED